MEPQNSTKSTDLLRGILESYPGSSNLGSLAISLIKELIALRSAAANEKWSKVKELGIRCLGLGYGVYRVLQGEFTSRGQQSSSLISSIESFNEELRQIAQGPNRAAFFAQFRERLTAKRPELLESLDNALRKLEQGQIDGVSLLTALVPSEQLQRVPIASDQAADALMACLARGSLGIIHSDFNLAYQALQSEAASIAEADVWGTLKALTEEVASGLRERQRAIYDSLASDRSARETVGSAEALTAFVEQALPRLARSQAVAHLISEVLRGQDQGGKAEAIGRLAMQAGILTRESIASRVAASRLALDLMRLQVPETIGTLISQASTTQFDGRLPNGKNTPLAKLDQVSEGAFVEIEGFVTGLKVVRLADKKLISRIQLTDSSNGATATAAAIFTHLPHAGVTRGSFCRITGIFHKQSKLLAGKPGVEVDRLSEAELSESIWRVAFIRIANRWFENWRNGNNMYWSMGPHHLVSAPNTISQFGAGEIIFTPFVRK